MTKFEFLGDLSRLISDLPAKDKEQAMEYYEDKFADAGFENEENLIHDFVSPEYLAGKIREISEQKQNGELPADTDIGLVSDFANDEASAGLESGFFDTTPSQKKAVSEENIYDKSEKASAARPVKKTSTGRQVNPFEQRTVTAQAPAGVRRNENAEKISGRAAEAAVHPDSRANHEHTASEASGRQFTPQQLVQMKAARAYSAAQASSGGRAASAAQMSNAAVAHSMAQGASAARTNAASGVNANSGQLQREKRESSQAPRHEAVQNSGVNRPSGTVRPQGQAGQAGNIRHEQAGQAGNVRQGQGRSPQQRAPQMNGNSTPQNRQLTPQQLAQMRAAQAASAAKAARARESRGIKNNQGITDNQSAQVRRLKKARSSGGIHIDESELGDLTSEDFNGKIVNPWEAKNGGSKKEESERQKKEEEREKLRKETENSTFLRSNKKKNGILDEASDTDTEQYRDPAKERKIKILVAVTSPLWIVAAVLAFCIVAAIGVLAVLCALLAVGCAAGLVYSFVAFLISLGNGRGGSILFFLGTAIFCIPAGAFLVRCAIALAVNVFTGAINNIRAFYKSTRHRLDMAAME